MLGSAASFQLRSVAVALALLLCARSAVAQEPPAEKAAADVAPALEIAWKGPEDCDRADAVRAKVWRLLGGSQRALATSFKVSVTVHREKASRYVAELETTTSSGAGGTKRLEGESCDAIALATSVVIALSVDPNASLDAEPTPETPPPPPPPKAPPKPLKKAPPRPAKGIPREVFPYLHGSVGVLFGLLSKPSAFSAAGVGVRYRRFSLELGGAVYQSRSVASSERPAVGAELRLGTGELLSCYAFLPFQLGAGEACPGFRLEYLSARAFGVSNPDQGSVLLGAGIAALRGRLRATSWLSATLDAGVALRPFHPTFVLLGVGNVFAIPVVSPFARTGLVLEF